MSEDKTTGVQQLIDRLSDEGVAEGQRQSEKIVADAQQKADDILGMTLITHQTGPRGQKVGSVLIAEAVEIASEFYLGI